MLYFVETLNEILQDKNISKLEFAKSINLPIGTIYNLKRYNPTIETALLIVDYFSSSIDYFERKVDKFKYVYNKKYSINFYSNMREIMKTQNIKKKSLCSDLGISHSSIDRWATGVLPTYSNLVLIADYLGCSIDSLLGRV